MLLSLVSSPCLSLNRKGALRESVLSVGDREFGFRATVHLIEYATVMPTFADGRSGARKARTGSVLIDRYGRERALALNAIDGIF